MHISFTITDESLKYRAHRRIRANTVQYTTNIRRTPDAWITDRACPNMHASLTFHVQSLSFCDKRDTCTVHGCSEGLNVDMRGFEPVLTHKHRQPTRVPRIVTHTRHINYALRLMNNTHNFFNRSKLKIMHKPPSTRIHLQSLTVHDKLRIRCTLYAVWLALYGRFIGISLYLLIFFHLLYAFLFTVFLYIKITCYLQP